MTRNGMARAAREVWTVFVKEMRETIRDRRTLLIMVVVPVVLYPLLLVIAQQLSLFGMRRIEAEPSVVSVVGETSPELIRFLEDRDDLELVLADDAQRAVRAGRVRAAATIASADGDEGTQAVTVFFDAANDRSQRGRSVLLDALEEWGDTVLQRRLAARSLPETFARPMALSDTSIARPEELGGYALGRFLPLLLIVITLLGVFYPAIDLAAGEKERGTLETLLTAPTPARQIVAGKFITVAVVGLVAAGLNLASMLLTFQSGLFQFSQVLDIEFSLPLRSVLVLFVTLVPLAVLFGSLFLGIAVRARSFKEAQNALTPVYMLVLVPALLPLFPGIDFSPVLALVPVAGVALLFRELMAGSAPFLAGALAILSTLVYACLALLFAADSFGREEVLFGTGDDASAPRAGGGRFRRFREAARERGVPTPGEAAAFVAFVGLLFFYLGFRFQVGLGERGLLLSEWLLLFGSAVAFVALAGYRFRDTFSLRLPSARHALGAAVLIAGATPTAWFLAWLQGFVIPIPWELLEGLERFVVAEDARRLVWLLFLVALTPAICEEAVFRGVLFAGTRDRLSPTRLILVNGLVFGAFHVSYETVFRFLPTAWLGVVLAYAVWRSRSIWTSALMHFLSNGTIVLMAASPALRERFSGPDARPPLVVLPVALAALAAGVYLLRGSGPRSREAAETQAPAPAHGD